MIYYACMCNNQHALLTGSRTTMTARGDVQGYPLLVLTWHRSKWKVLIINKNTFETSTEACYHQQKLTIKGSFNAVSSRVSAFRSSPIWNHHVSCFVWTLGEVLQVFCLDNQHPVFVVAVFVGLRKTED